MNRLRLGLATILALVATVVAQTLAPSTSPPPTLGFDPAILKDLDQPATHDATASGGQPVAAADEVQCATLIYATNKQSKCFAPLFLADLSKHTYVRARPQFVPVRLDAKELFRYPFSVMSGEGTFQLTAAERENLRRYMENGGFLLASAGCSSKPWADSFKAECKHLFPARELVKLSPEHPLFHTVYDIKETHYKVGRDRFPDLFGVEIDGRMALIFSPDGLNDSDNAGKNCCCCGGNEIKAARQINVNVVAYALTH